MVMQDIDLPCPFRVCLLFLIPSQLLDGGPLRLQPLLLCDDRWVFLAMAAGAVILKLLQQCLEALIEVGEG